MDAVVKYIDTCKAANIMIYTDEYYDGNIDDDETWLVIGRADQNRNKWFKFE